MMKQNEKKSGERSRTRVPASRNPLPIIPSDMEKNTGMSPHGLEQGSRAAIAKKRTITRMGIISLRCNLGARRRGENNNEHFHAVGTRMRMGFAS
jgi:hypothetical protein